MRTEFQSGVEYMRSYLSCVLIGWQNGVGHSNPNDPEYKAYQRMIETLETIEM